MRFVTIVWIREIKLAKIIFLCLILKFEEIFPKNRKLSPKDKTYIVKLLEDINYNKWEISEDIISKLKAMVK